MPIYEYLCGACGHHLEEFQRFSDEPLKVCPNCNQPELHKQISATSFQLKGTGWYVTDTRDKGKPKPAASENNAEAAKESVSKETDTAVKADTSTEAKKTEAVKPPIDKPATKE